MAQFRTVVKNQDSILSPSPDTIDTNSLEPTDKFAHGVPSFFYEEDLGNPDLILKVIPRANDDREEPSDPIVGLIEQDFVFGVNNEYEAPMQEMGSSISKTLNMALSGLTGVFGGDNQASQLSSVISGTQGGQMLLNPRSSTFLMWTGHDRPVIQLQFNWLRLRRSDKPLVERVLEVFKTASPGQASGFMAAPNGYGMLDGMKEEVQKLATAIDSKNKNFGSSYAIDLKNIARGTYTLTLGRWFVLDGLIVENAEVTFSAQTPTDDGDVDQVAITMTLKPVVTLTYSDIQKIFRIRPSATLI